MRRRPTFSRVDRVGALMKDEVERVVQQELSNPLAQHVQVTGTKLSADMGHLRVRFVMRPRETEADLSSDTGSGSPEKAQLMLDRAAGYVARVLCDMLQLRKAPKVVFSYDKEFARMRRVRQVLDEDRARRGAPDTDEG